MYRAATLLAVLAVTSVFPSYIQAQQMEMLLVRNEAMQEELKITAEQKEKIESIIASWQEGSRAARAELAPSRSPAASETESPGDRFRKYYEATLPNTTSHYEKLEAVLKPEQLRRLSEVALQWRATDVAGYIHNSPRVAKELELSDDQKKRIADAFFSRFAGRGSRPRVDTPSETRERNEKVLAILSDDQRNKLKSMEGKPFDDLQKLQTASRRGSADTMFARFDKNTDGKLTESETGERFWSTFGRFDTDKDGAVDKDEFAKGMADRPQGLRIGGNEGSRDAVFARYDKNSDGKLTESETTESVWSRYGRFDTNGDDAVDKDEFAKEFAAYGWFSAGSSPGQYRMGRDASVSHGGNAAGVIIAEADEPTGFGTLMQSFNASEYRGKRVRLSAQAKTEEVEGYGGLWMRVDGSQESYPFDNMAGRPLKGTVDWAEYEIVLDIPDDALGIAFGFLMRGNGQMWVDDFAFDVVDQDTATTGPERPVRQLDDEARAAMERSYQSSAKLPFNLGFETPGRLLGIVFRPPSNGLEVLRVLENRKGAEAGIKPGDVVLKIDGNEVSERSQLLEELHKGEPTKEITLRRGDEQITISVKFAH